MIENDKSASFNLGKDMKTIQMEVPEKMYEKAAILVKDGWYRDEKDIFVEAIRRFLESHQPELMDRYILDDLEWGLHGKD
jgi:Arc/MetJ-type ribon-helix-helix transcriptional regulator